MAAKEPSTVQWTWSLLEPGLLLLYGMSYYARVNLEAVFKKGQLLAPILQTGRLRDEAFGRFWIAFSSPTHPSPLSPPPQITCSSDLIPSILAHASGLVLDVGPGTGTQLPLLRSPAIETIYGAEPCQGLHDELRERARAEGLAEKYRVLGCSVAAKELVPALAKEGLPAKDGEGNGKERGVFDSIICVRVLCSVPDLNRTVKDLYSLLKPGGKLLVVEHVVNPWRSSKGSLVARIAQAVYGLLGWSWFIGSCCLDRDTETALREAAEVDGGWEVGDLDRHFGSGPLPYVSGVLVKRS
ncbi:S-adenosyl-L-methionine-dependent methyltransferase [Aspergillus campestris IBT 28561]|uniref:S-adenosyl-L-methionine-dependent methyltransferase n=1 Tax=Aspergillus campestris (strain IBT 28561) TaxID=1392248 RepID=A0A2I1D8I8_ASPC2|nr:S-adenosyl-L-methionine-dependent methyltransferase [Aspergillus campestris IBT 28561]PKY06192.1 S-adenosyl-L-methionine-dependent methyltransferase [Aspergillus campestris IBT 28561]